MIAGKSMTVLQKTPFDKYDEKQILFILLFLIISVALFVFHDYLFFNRLYLFKDIGSDSINNFYPRIIHMADYLRNEGFPKWSFNEGMGQNFYANNLGNPFEWILLMLGRDYLAYGIIYVEVLKIVLGGAFFYLYLRMLPLTPFTAIAGGLLFSFSSFMILGGGWYQFSVQAVYLALLLYAFERYLNKNSWGLFPIAIALISASRPFSLYTHAIFFLLYGIFRYIDINGWKPKELSIFLVKLAGLGTLGAALSSVFMFSGILEMIQSPRVAGNASHTGQLSSHSLFGLEGMKHNITAITRFYSDNLLGTGSAFKGWQNYLEAPMFYCGLISLLLAPQLYSFLDRRRMILYSTFALLFILPIIFPYFRYAFWAFTGDYYRIFSFFVAIVLLFFSMQALSRISESTKANPILNIATLLVLVAILYYCSTVSPVDRGLRNIAISFLIFYTIIIHLFSFKNIRLACQLILLALICAELGYFSSITVNDRSAVTAQEYKEKVGYNDFTMEATAYLNSTDHSFYRVEKIYRSNPAIHTSLNDALVQNYRGTSSYRSFNQLNYIKFLAGLNVINGSDEHQTRWAPGLISRPLLLTFASVKYLLTKGNQKTLLGNTYTDVAKFGDVTVLKNNNYLPLGFTYDHYLSLTDFKKLSDHEKDIAILNAFIIDESSIDKLQGLSAYSMDNFNGKSTTYSIGQYTEDVNHRKQDTLSINSYDQNHFKGTINLAQKKLLFFSIPFDSGWSARVDGKQAQLMRVNLGFMGLVLDKGEHSIDLEFSTPYVGLGSVVSLTALLLYAALLWWDSRKDRRQPLRRPLVTQ